MTRANGLRLFTSNRLEILAEQLARVAESPLGSPFAAETVLVQSQGMARWLQMELARRLGVCANVRFPFPKAFSEEVARLVLPDQPEESPFQLDALAWRIMGLLPTLLAKPAFADLKNYLADPNDQRRHWQLAEKIAHVFDQYLIFRPELILKWDTGGDEQDWQAILWRELAIGARTAMSARTPQGKLAGKPVRVPGAWHPAAVHAAVIDRLHSVTAVPSGLPERIALFGISVLPPFYLQLFGALARHVPVNIFLLQPCAEFWGDLVGTRRAGKVLEQLDLLPGAESAAHLQTGNRLLVSLGRQGQEFFNLIQELDRVEPVESFAEPGDASLLTTIQTDILNLRDRGNDPGVPTAQIDPADDSIQVHSCHSPLRELEVLHDHLLAWFQRDPQLAPRDILVLMPDLATYAPLVPAVFGAPEDESRRIPFNVADRGARQENHVVETFLKLLNLASTRLGINSVLELLQSTAVHERFGLVDRDLERIHSWVDQAGIRWGIDAAHRAEWNVPALADNTWRLGLDRLLLGFAMAGHGAKMFRDLLPVDDVEGNAAQVLGRFVEFAERVFSAVKALQKPHTVSEWQKLFLRLIEEFFVAGDEVERELQSVRQSVGKLSRAARLADFGEEVGLSVILESLVKLLDEDSAGAGFLTGGVTFCALKPMRSLPFKIVCLVGMSDNAFPRQTSTLGFDKMNHEHRPGDRSSREDDRMLFLETIISARERLYLSYVGQSIRDNAAAPPSVIVSELLDYIGQGFVGDGGDSVRAQIETKHRLQAFSPAYFSGDKLFSFSDENCAAARAVAAGGAAPRPFIMASLNAPEPIDEWKTVSLETLAKFFAYPADFFLKRRLRLALTQEDATLEDSEAMELNSLGAFQLNQSLLEHTLAGRDVAVARAVIRAEGRLPLGVVGEVRLREAETEMEQFYGRLRPELPSAPSAPVEIDLALGEFRVTGTLTQFGREGLLHFRCANVKPKDRLRLWIEHLAMCALRPVGLASKSVLLGKDSMEEFGPVEAPEKVLSALLREYWAGISSPLKFFPDSSWKFMSTLNSVRATTPPLEAARGTWEGAEFKPGESDAPAYRLCFRDVDPIDEEFERVTRVVLEPLLAHRTERK